MADSVSMTIKSTSQTGKKLSRSITDISPTATDAQLETLGNALNTLTTNHLSSLTRVQTSEIDTSQRFNITLRRTINGGSAAMSYDADSHTVTIDHTKIDSSDVPDMDFTAIISTPEGNKIITLNTVNVVFGNEIYVGFVNSGQSTALSISTATETTMTGTSTVTIPAGEYNGYSCNAAVITIQVV